MKNYHELINRLYLRNLNLLEFTRLLKSFFDFDFLDDKIFIDHVLHMNYMFERTDINVVSKNINIDKANFCFVDIECSGSNYKFDQIIEIGAIMVSNNVIIDKFHSLVYCKSIPYKIQKLTGITENMLLNSPNIKHVLSDFRDFLRNDSIFVSHGIIFDYNFIFNSFKLHNITPMLNPSLCTFELSKRTILSKKYGLKYLNEMLGINEEIHHRALEDANVSRKIFDICLLSLPKIVNTIQDLINFSKNKINYPY